MYSPKSWMNTMSVSEYPENGRRGAAVNVSDSKSSVDAYVCQACVRTQYNDIVVSFSKRLDPIAKYWFGFRTDSSGIYIIKTLSVLQSN